MTENKNLFEFEPIKGYPMLNWRGKRPYKSTLYYPAQLKEVYGKEKNGWINKIYWGDNLQVMSHLLREYRGKINLIYIDPPFDSKAEYKKTIELKGKSISNDRTAFEEKQYTDIWTNDEYLQFMYERLILMRELLADNGSIYIECDPIRGHYLKIILDEIFGQSNFVNQIIWKRTFSHGDSGQGAKHLGRLHDIILFYSKSSNMLMNTVYTPYTEKYINDFYKFTDENGKKYRLVSLLGPGGASKGNPYFEFLGVSRYWVHSKSKMEQLYKEGKIVQTKPGTVPQKKRFLDESPGVPLQDIWIDINAVQGGAIENYNYPTQKPESLIERIIKASSNPNDIVFDCFMGSGTTQAVAMKLGRRFIGADINLGAIQTTTKRLIGIQKELTEENEETRGCNPLFPDIEKEAEKYTGFEVYTVNNYDFFRNPVQAKELLIQALEVNKYDAGNIFDGEKDGKKVKIMPVNRIATKADLTELISNLPYKEYEKKSNDNPNAAVDNILLVCMGHEPDVAPAFEKEIKYKVNIEVVDILRDREDLIFKRESEGELVIENNTLIIKQFYPMNLLQKLSLMKENVSDYKELVESVMIDWDYDGNVLEPKEVDVPGKNELIKGAYPIPKDAQRIRVKITDLLSESLELEIKNG